MMKDEKDYVELKTSTGQTYGFVEDPDGWWRLEGGDEGWELTTDPYHGFLTSLTPPGCPTVTLGDTIITHRGRHLVVASIRKVAGQLMMILMPG